ncbi:MAG: helix-turn-helix domain-containing protein [Candidatus Colwellbacteria bacterium]|nr:helix-turn-helix domain-containing protein [Candidatus Colwellbacteria bacterium]
MNEKNIGEILAESAGDRGFSIEKISEATNVPKRYVTALFENDIKNMPAAPYVRGYISKIAAFLGIEQRLLEDAYKRLDLRVAGKEDSLPKNRFAIAKSRKTFIWLVVIITIIALFSIIRLNSLLGIPEFEVNLPAKIDDRDYLETRSQMIAIEGKIAPKDSISINREPIPADKDGFFSKEVILEKGLNTFEITVKRLLGKETTIIRKVFYIVDETEEEIPEQKEQIEEIIIEGESAE